jgi:hypothetical protein
MPQAPIIIPIIVTGITFGSLLVSEKHRLSKKKLVGVSALSGILNLGNAFLMHQLFPPPTLTRAATQFRAATAGSEYVYYASSFIVGFLLVLVIVGIALIYARLKGARPEEDEESKLEET